MNHLKTERAVTTLLKEFSKNYLQKISYHSRDGVYLYIVRKILL
jgi:hypothetical protein